VSPRSRSQRRLSAGAVSGKCRDSEASVSLIYRTRTPNLGAPRERKTGFEPATLTLARCCDSSNQFSSFPDVRLRLRKCPRSPLGFSPVVERSTTGIAIAMEACGRSGRSITAFERAPATSTSSSRSVAEVERSISRFIDTPPGLGKCGFAAVPPRRAFAARPCDVSSAKPPHETSNEDSGH
jgi:hypothetical protein